MDVDLSPSEYLTQSLTNPSLPQELKPYYTTFQRLYDGRLWYQLTSAIEAFLSVPQSGPYQIKLFQHFINDFATKLNQLKLVTIGITVARQFNGKSVGGRGVGRSVWLVSQAASWPKSGPVANCLILDRRRS